MMVRGLIERDQAASRFALTEQRRAVLAALLGRSDKKRAPRKRSQVWEEVSLRFGPLKGKPQRSKLWGRKVRRTVRATGQEDDLHISQRTASTEGRRATRPSIKKIFMTGPPPRCLRLAPLTGRVCTMLDISTIFEI